MNVKEEEQELEAIQAAIYTEYENVKTAAQRLLIALTQKEIPTRPESNVFGDNTLDCIYVSSYDRDIGNAGQSFC